MFVEIDKDSGFCFGVVNAINNAEKALQAGDELFCLGDIVHNSHEVSRLQKQGLKTIDHNALLQLKNSKVLLRAHGEPPSTYQTAKENNITIVDATCPVVLQLQKKIYKQFTSTNPERTQIVIYGKIGHAEVNGLVGQTSGYAIVIEKKEDLNTLDFGKDIYLFSQTTMSLHYYQEIVNEIQHKMQSGTTFLSFDTICRQVANRMPNIKLFATRHDVILFVAGKKSSNGKALYEECKKANPATFLISDAKEIESKWLQNAKSVGVCGATSTPLWLMENVANAVSKI